MTVAAADGTKKIAWENNVRTYVPSMVASDGHLFAVMDAGVAVCFDAATGDEVWKGRLAGTFSSSPILVGDRIYATNEDGTTFVYRASPKEFELLATNDLGDSVFSTPVICGSRIYLRSAFMENGTRQEYLYCLGSKDQ
ncbi:MAG: PQQ-binding-like beta-propeller repeat protein [Planctomycetaceae bacterium]